MIKFVEVYVHYYMDMHPFKEVYILDTETMHEWCKEQQQNWGSGTVSISRVLTAQEALDYCKKTFAKIIENQPVDEVQDEEDRGIVQNLITEYRRCYLTK